MAAAPAAVAESGFDFFAALWGGTWLRFLPVSLREPTARLVVLGVGALVSMLLFAPAADQRGEAYIEATFARTLAALAATRGLDSAISLAQSSEVSFSFGPGGSLGIGQALDPVNDLVEQYGSLLLTSTTALGTQRVAMQIGRALGWWLFVPSLTAIVGSSLVGVGVLGLTTAVNYAASGLIDWRVAAFFLTGGIVGGWFGMMLALRLAARRAMLTRLFAGALFIVAAVMIFRTATALGLL